MNRAGYGDIVLQVSDNFNYDYIRRFLDTLGAEAAAHPIFLPIRLADLPTLNALHGYKTRTGWSNPQGSIRKLSICKVLVHLPQASL